MFGDIFCHHTKWGVCILLASSGWKPGLLFYTLQCTGCSTREDDPALNVSCAQFENALNHEDHRAGANSLQKHPEKESKKALKRRPQPPLKGTCFPPAMPVGSAAHSVTAKLLASAPFFGLNCPPLEDQEARSQAVPLTVGELVGESPGKLRGKKRFRAALALGQAPRRPYLHPHHWATRWTGCCQPPGSGLSRDRRHHRQGSPSRCHRWTWGAWWCWERRKGIRWAKGGPRYWYSG